MSQPRFTQGSTMKHIIVMSLSNAAGITTLFIVDLLDLFFLSLLGEKFLAAAIGYAGTILFLTSSLGIGLSIAAGALVSRAIGSHDRERACQYQVNICFLVLFISITLALVIWLLIPQLLTLLGATGQVHDLAVRYLNILIPSMPLVSLAMTLGAGLRAVGDAKLSMTSSLCAGAVNAVLDPILIFLLDLNIEGAAIASVMARVTLFSVVCYGIFRKHKLYSPFRFILFNSDLKNIMSIALPAIGTNLAMPFSSAWMVRYMSQYGDSYVAGYSIINRLVPVAFGVIFALSGAVGPIVGQNFGARLIGRVRESFRNAIFFTVIYVILISVVLFLLQDILIEVFRAKRQAASLVSFFCTWIAISFVFTGCLFVTNAVFNNLGKPGYSTLLNWGRATLGTLPFIWLASESMGAYGVLVGQAAGGVLFSVIAIWLGFRTIDSIDCKVTRQNMIASIMTHQDETMTCAFNPMSSECSQLAQMAEEGECEEACNLPDKAKQVS
ncbi:MATE family efflux transporter [Endozoicomonas numazuensis]|uniref:Multidrug transporter MatE n=1 Tax=Endozoicomonas numazuensis TaxID=1137799 RepID=A0A081NFK0_9GAMM|nr:MATE family efflux transporter [Endozoicomonas numazuensis]KEQ17223.1 multidrug transporter MatE [Endozoicomonas numazuensis]